MPTRPPVACPRCGTPRPAGQPCQGCTRGRIGSAARARKGKPQPYKGKRWRAARTATLRRDPVCRCAGECTHHDQPCQRISHVADHWPQTRRELIVAGVPDPDHPKFLRGLCDSCHSAITARDPRTATRYGR